MFILDFFDKNKPCLDEYKDLKDNYLKELSEIEHYSCVQCDLVNLREKYLKILLQIQKTKGSL